MRSIVTLLAPSAVAIVATIAVTNAQQVTLRSAEIHPDGYPTVEAVKYMGELIAKETNGSIAIKIWPRW